LGSLDGQPKNPIHQACPVGAAGARFRVMGFSSRLMGRYFFGWLGLGLAVSQFAAAKPEALVPARFQQSLDARGMRWDLTPDGTINDGSNDCFDTAEMLQLNRSRVGFSQPMMTADGAEFVFAGRNREFVVSRRVRLDAALGVMRYLESVTNTGRSPATVQLTLISTLGGSAQQVVDENQVPILTLGPKQGALAAMQNGSRPGVVFLLTDGKAKVRPSVTIQDNRRFEVTYDLTIPAGATVSVVHYVAQRPGATKRDIVDLQNALTKRGRLADSTIDRKTLETLVNFPGGAAEPDAPASILAPLDELAVAAETERGASDTLCIDASTKLAGTVTGNSFDLDTSFGRTRIEFKELAGVAGGDGVQRMPRIFLRSGDILTGTVTGADYHMLARNGLKLPLDFAAIHLLILRKAAADATAGAKPLWLVGTYRGERLVIAADDASPLEVATPWGAASVPFRDVAALTYLRDPFPAHRLVTADGSRLLVMPHGGELKIPGTRFGVVKLMPQMVRTIERVEPAGTVTKPDEEDDSDDVTTPQSDLTGDNRLVGALETRELHLASDAGLTPVATSAIIRLEAPDPKDAKEGVEPQWTVRLADDQELHGRLVEKVLPIRSAGRIWNVPASHLITFRAPKPAPKPTPTPSPSASPSALAKP
jgi:hypothetical protein